MTREAMRLWARAALLAVLISQADGLDPLSSLIRGTLWRGAPEVCINLTCVLASPGVTRGRR